MSQKSGELEIINFNQPVYSRRVPGPGIRRKKKSRSGIGLLIIGAVVCLVLGGVASSAIKGTEKWKNGWMNDRFGGEKQEIETFLDSPNIREEYPQKMLELAERNEEALDFVRDYPNRAEYQNQPVDLSGDYTEGRVPLLMQWDKRWGYDSYGDSNIGLSGCGPVCLNMAYLYFTGDTQMNPREMAQFAYNSGYYTSAGTSWDLWTEGVEALGLTGEPLSLEENAMKSTLDHGGLIVCSMAPGDFTTTGHFILLKGYDEEGFFVNDPNRHSTSEKQWDFETLQYQIKNLWGIYP